MCAKASSRKAKAHRREPELIHHKSCDLLPGRSGKYRVSAPADTSAGRTNY
jgi:hypothetical protein